MRTRPVSSGWRRACRTGVWNSASSSRKSTPWCALEISPGIAKPLPPPMRPAIKTPWRGPRKGRAQSTGWSRGSSPTKLRSSVDSSDAAGSRRGRMPERQRPSRVVPVPDGAVQRELAQECAVRRRLLARERQDDGDCDRQVQRRAFLAQLGRREADGEARARIVQAAVLDRRAHALARLFDSRRRKPDETKSDIASAADISLDMDTTCLEAREHA